MKWTEEEDSFLRRYHKQLSHGEISELLDNRTQKAIEHRMSHLGLTERRTTSIIKWTPQECSVLEMYQRGEITRSQVSAFLPERSEIAITSKINKSELVFRHTWNDIDDAFLKEHYRSWSLSDMASYFGVTQSSIAHRLSRLNLYRGRQYRLDEDYFYNVTDESAYWAGFIAADGNICDRTGRLSISLSTKDEDHLFKFKNMIGYEGHIRHRSNERWGKIHYSATLSLTSQGISGALRSIYNIVPNKSLILEPPNLERSSHIKSFVVGYIDGDGFVSDTKDGWGVGVAGTAAMMSYIKGLFDSEYPPLNERYAQINIYNNISRFIVTGKRVSYILEDLITLNIPFMDRKWRKVFNFFGCDYE